MNARNPGTEQFRRRIADLAEQNAGFIRYADKLGRELKEARLANARLSAQVVALADERDEERDAKAAWRVAAFIAAALAGAACAALAFAE